jgi:Flp pilus assembly protein TadD
VTQSVARSTLLAVLLAGYAALFSDFQGSGGGDAPFDPLSPHGRQVEQAIETRQFAEALPVALDLQRAAPRDPQIAYWLAEIYRGLDRPREEAQAWEMFVSLDAAPAAACPAIGEVYARLNDPGQVLRAYERCATFDPDNPERLIDLAAALERQGRADQAVEAYRRVAALDPDDPRVASRIEALTRLAQAR